MDIRPHFAGAGFAEDIPITQSYPTEELNHGSLFRNVCRAYAAGGENMNLVIGLSIAGDASAAGAVCFVPTWTARLVR